MKIHGGFDLIDLDGIALDNSTVVPGLYARCAELGDKTIKIGGYTLSGSAVEAEPASITKDAYNNYVITSAEHIVTVSTGDYVVAAANSGGGGSQYVLPAATADALGGIKVGSGLSVESDGTLSATGSQYSLPAASASTLGGVKVGSGLSVTEEGVLSATGGGSGSFDGVYVIEDTSFIYNAELGGLYAANIAGIYNSLVNSPRPVVLVDSEPNGSIPTKVGRVYDIEYTTASVGSTIVGYAGFSVNVAGTPAVATLSGIHRIKISNDDYVVLDTVSLGS